MNENEETSTGGPTLTEQERECAQNALSEFNKGNYIGCLQQLNKLDSRNHDYKVLLNRAVAEYFKSDLKKTDNFKKLLNNIFSIARMRPEVIDDVEQCVLQFNLAVLLYHQQQYAASLRIANRLFSFIEPMDDSLSHRVCLLLIELHIATYQPEKAIGLINYIENQILNPDMPVLLSGDREIKILKKEPKDKKKLDSATEIFQHKLTQYRVRCDLNSQDLKSAKRDIKDLILDNEVAPVNYCLRAQYEYLHGSFSKAMKILNQFPVSENDFKTTGESSNVIFYNNMGIIHHAMGKPHLATHYIQKALQHNEANTSMTKSDSNEPLSGRPLYTLGGTKKHELMLNLGIVLLHAGRGAQAFDCLVIAVQRYHRNPRLWLRLAECCIQVHKSSNKVDFDPKRQSEIIKERIGRGKHSKFVFTTNLSHDKKYSAESQSYAVPVPTLEFASLCLRNALALLPLEIHVSVSPPMTLTGPGVAPPLNEPCVAPSAIILPEDIILLRNSVLIASAYVSLCLGDYVMTLEYTDLLFEQPFLSGANKLLGHLYAAESLVLMNRIPEALAHLDIEQIKDINLFYNKDLNSSNEEKSYFTINTKPPTSWFPNTIETAHVILRYNTAVIFAMRGEYAKASDLLKQIWKSRSNSCQVPIHVVMLVVYVELQQGHTELAKSIIKQHYSKHR